MNSLYLDTNIFIYLSDKTEPHHKICTQLIRECRKNSIQIITSAETIQEIIHLAKNTKQLTKGIKMSKNCLKIVEYILPVNEEVINIYLQFTAKYRNAGSRDLIHLAVCVENKVDRVVTFDKDFTKFKEIKILHPQDILS